MTPRRILITGDLLRPASPDPNHSESVRRIRWFQDLLTLPLTTVTGLPVDRLACEGAMTLGALYEDCGLTPSLDSWAELYAGQLSPRLRDRILDWCDDAIVISKELPPCIATVLRDAGIPLIDCVVDPHRFLTDIPLSWRSTVPAVRDALEPFRISSYEIRWRAAQVRAKSRWIHPVDVPDGATLVLDQVPSDSAMIDPCRRRRVGWSDYLEQVAALRADGPVLWRPHPYNHDTEAVANILGADARAHANIYQLLSHDHLRRVVAISSGGVIEARAFGKEGVHFLNRHAGISLEGWSTPVPVVGAWLSPHFWSAVLAPLTPTCSDVPVLAPEKDSLRRLINCDWGFGWIDRVVAE